MSGRGLLPACVGAASLALACNAVLGIEEGTPRPAGGDASVGGTGGGAAGVGGGAGASGGTSGTAGSSGASGSGGASGGAGGSGGSSGSGGTAGVGGASGGSGGADAGVITTCPSSPPNTSSACANGLSCSYGTHPDAACRDSYACNGSGWTANLPGCAAVPSCTTLPSFPVIGQLCIDVPGGVVNGTSCALTGTVRCRCVCDGASCSPGQEKWQCSGPPSGCPDFLPNEGQPCTNPNPQNSCKYYFCDFGWETEAKCGSGGTWEWTPLSCPP